MGELTSQSLSGNSLPLRLVVADMPALTRTAVVVTLVFSATCANAPTDPGGTAAMNRIVIADRAGALRPVDAAIRATLEGTLDRVVAQLPMAGLTITVTPEAGRAIGGWGIGGFTTDGRTIDLFVDPAFPNLSGVLPERLARMLAHEAHHAARFRGPGYGRTLLEAMVSEGLADHFAAELLGGDVSPWSRAFPDDETPVYLDRARPVLDRADYGHDAWFFGATPALPRWVGYTLGYRLVERYKATHPGATATTLVNTGADAFRPR